MRKMRHVHGNIYNFVPESFMLPNEYIKFLQLFSEETHQQRHSNAGNTNSIWICKPADLSRGRKIFVFNDVAELNYDQQNVVQRYVKDPLLIHGYKFDLRIYVLVTSFHPLTVYLYRNGLVRFSTEKYVMLRKVFFVGFSNTKQTHARKHVGMTSISWTTNSHILPMPQSIRIAHTMTLWRKA